MQKPFKLSDVTAMKLQCCKYVNDELQKALEEGREGEAKLCQQELKQLQYEAMHPQEVIDSIQHLFPDKQKS